MSAWKLVVELCLPTPFVLLVLLLMPAPKAFHRGVLRLVERTLGLRFVGVFSLLNVMLFVSAVAFASSIKTTMDLAQQKNQENIDVSPNIAAGFLSKKWRAERNFWIAFICFVMWSVLARLYHILLRKIELEDLVAAHQAEGAQGAPTRPPDAVASSKAPPVASSKAPAMAGPTEPKKVA